ncbi:MAG TPA: RNase adapter RapZ, partial [Actinomycetota bacterium]|nr:RNase adapter RapZ [Actinomycetota bacterium]
MTQELRTEDRLRAATVEFVVITGLSGAGRSEAAKVLEDLGYFVIDNLPPSLIGRVAELAVGGRDRTRVALVMDARGGALATERDQPEEDGRRRKFAYPPNLIVIDGGRPQLSAAVEAIRDSASPD